MDFVLTVEANGHEEKLSAAQELLDVKYNESVQVKPIPNFYSAVEFVFKTDSYYHLTQRLRNFKYED